MKIKVSEATNIQLDWLVAKSNNNLYPVGDVRQLDGRLFTVSPGSHDNADAWHKYEPTADWAQGGPLLNHPTIGVVAQVEDSSGFCAYRVEGKAWMYYYDDDLLGAICMAFVASKLGDEVEIPEELK